MKRLTLLFGLLAIIVLVAGCSNQASTPEQQETPQEEQINKQESTSQTVELDEPSLVFSLEGENYPFRPALAAGNTPVHGFLTVMTKNAGIQLRMLPNEVGTYHAGEGPSDNRLVDVWFRFKNKEYRANKEVGEASITLIKTGSMPETIGDTSYTGVASGTFTGTFVAEDGSSITITDGKFMTAKQ